MDASVSRVEPRTLAPDATQPSDVTLPSLLQIARSNSADRARDHRYFYLQTLLPKPGRFESVLAGHADEQTVRLTVAEGPCVKEGHRDISERGE